MADGARVQDIEAIRGFRASLVKFIEASNAALVDAESEITKRLSWVEGEQSAYWQHNIRKLQDLIGQLKEQIRMKKLFKDSSGRTPSAFDEEKKLRAAQQKLELAEQKLVNCRKWAKQLQREHLMYRGGVQRLQTMLSSDLIVGVSTLDKVVVQIEQYLNAGAPSVVGSDAFGTERPTGTESAGGQMTRTPDAASPATDQAAAQAEQVTESQEESAPAVETSGRRIDDGSRPSSEPENA